MSKRKGFTLIELLVVISIIALLVSILMPALNRARQQATASVCLGNDKALIASWLMYTTDNSDKIVGGMVAGYKGQQPYADPGWDPANKAPWVCSPTVEDTSGNGNHLSLGDNAAQLSTFEALDHRKFGIELGELWKYNKTHEVYHCPGDKNFKKDAPKDSFVSYAITGAMNGEDTMSGRNGVDAYIASNQIKTPSEKMVFVEESTLGQSFLLGSFQVNCSDNKKDRYINSAWWDYLAVWHNKRGTIAFADGHAEINQWEYKKTLEIAEFESRNSAVETPKSVWCWDSTNNEMQPDLLKVVRWYGGRD